eukprot:TRINITY_DN7441_c0_g1_i1.p2 TRINITY_DN7441_c0_g1~~TRINITY_DN7441_c0_g1_i1.p2  ORF type:complete len:360 (+),score=115.36 TRINITY_DN7441_c0_g1_i1:973-2052(+)
MEASPALISMTCLELRKANGPSFNFSTIRMLLNLRTDIDKSDREEVLQSCREVLDQYETKVQNEKGGEKNAAKESFFSKLQQINEKEAQEEEGGDKNRRASITLDDDEEEEEEVVVKKVEETVEEKREEIPREFEGFMDKKLKNTLGSVLGDVGWQKRFFVLRKGSLYWYKDNRSRTAQNFYSLDVFESITPEKDNLFVIKFLDAGKEPLTLKVDSQELRDMWVKVLVYNLDLKKTGQFEVIVKELDESMKEKISGEAYIRDYDLEWVPPEIRPKGINMLGAFIEGEADGKNMNIGGMTEPTMMDALEIEDDDDNDRFHEEPPLEKPGCFTRFLIAIGIKKKRDGTLLHPHEREIHSMA